MKLKNIRQPLTTVSINYPTESVLQMTLKKVLRPWMKQVSDLTQRVQAVELKCTSTNDTTDEIAVVKQDLNKARRAINDNE